MSAPAWMPLYVADYLADTSHLGALQSGAYLHLIMHYWQHGGLPDDEAALARIARLTAAEWRRERAILSAFFHDGWKHKRIDAEIAGAEEIITARSAAGRAGANARWQNRGKRNAAANGKRMANALRTQWQNDAPSPSPSPSPSPEEGSLRSPSTREADDAIADEFEREFWPGWPNKVGKPAALKAFRTARKRHELAAIIAGRDRYVRDKPPAREWLNPATFLNQERFNDQPASTESAPGNGRSRDPHEPLFRAIVEQFAAPDGVGVGPPGDDGIDRDHAGGTAEDRGRDLDLAASDYRRTGRP